MDKWTLNQSWLATLLVGANIAAFAIFAVQRLSTPSRRPSHVASSAGADLPVNCGTSNVRAPVFSYVETQPEIVMASAD
jgi:hypothetical protein